MADEIVSGLPRDQHEYGMEKGHSPVAEGVVMLDFDGTLFAWGPLMGTREIEPGAAEAARAFRAAGYTIGIFTSRLSYTWAYSVKGDEIAADAFLTEQEQYVRRTLDEHGIPYDFVTAEKRPAVAYVDDRAIRYEGDWREVVRKVLAA